MLQPVIISSGQLTVSLATKHGGFLPGLVQFGTALMRESVTVTIYSTFAAEGVHVT